MKDNQEAVKVLSCTLAELLKCNIKALPHINVKGQLFIPEYQRPYVWGRKQIDKLLKDFKEYKNNKKEKSKYYLGSIIIHQAGNKLNIIDGQQRITTMLLLNALKTEPTVSKIEYTSPVSIKNIKNNHAYLTKGFEDINFEEINITLVITNNEDMAYTFFETLNTGGIRLSGTDIVKAHHLRAVEDKKQLKYQAQRWEKFPVNDITSTIEKLIKIRYWKNYKWQPYPFYRNHEQIKSTIIDEFSNNTNNIKNDISYYHYYVKRSDGIEYKIENSKYRDIRQPLYDGSNFLDYIVEYINLEKLLFKDVQSVDIDEKFYQLSKKLLHGKNGTIFLKELMQVAVIAYVSKFGVQRLYEVSLWLFRFIYSRRVFFDRNVREDSVFKFVKKSHLIDVILNSYTVEELIGFLKHFNYEFSSENITENRSKDKHITTIKEYFDDFYDGFTNIAEMAPNNIFDTKLIEAIEKVTDVRQ